MRIPSQIFGVVAAVERMAPDGAEVIAREMVGTTAIARSPEDAVASMASAQHELWRLPRMIEGGGFEPRWKYTTDNTWINAHPDQTRMVDGQPKVDIANLAYRDLPADHALDNDTEARNAVNAVLRYVSPGDRLNTRALDAASADIHAGWLARNGDRTDLDPLMRVAHADLPIEGKAKNWNIVRMAAENLGVLESRQLQSALIKRARRDLHLGDVDTADLFRDHSVRRTGHQTPLLPERGATHAAFFQQSLAGANPVEDGARHAVMLIGLPGSGKTTALQHLDELDGIPRNLASNSVVVDPDLAKSFIREYATLRAVGDPRASDVVHRESADMSSELQQRAIDGGYNVIMQRTGRHASDVGNLIEAHLQNGFDTHLVMTELAPDAALQRAHARALTSRRVVDEVYLRSIVASVAQSGITALRSAGGVTTAHIVDTAKKTHLAAIAERTASGELIIPDKGKLAEIAARAGVKELDPWLATTEKALREWKATPGSIVIDGDKVKGLRFTGMQEFQKHPVPVTIREARQDTPIKVSWQDSPLVAKAGQDYIATDGRSEWPVAKDIFHGTYSQQADGTWLKTATLHGRKIDRPFLVATLEGVAKGEPGAKLVQGPAGEAWPIQAETFARTYVPKQ